MRNHYMLILIWFRIIDINLSSRLIPKPFKRCSLFPCTGEVLVYSSFSIIGIAAHHFQQVQDNLPQTVIFPSHGISDEGLDKRMEGLRLSLNNLDSFIGTALILFEFFFCFGISISCLVCSEYPCCKQSNLWNFD